MLEKVTMYRGKLRALFATQIMQTCIAALLMISAITISWEITVRYHETAAAQTINAYLGIINTLILYIFAVEILLRIFAYGADYFKAPWNVFDFIVVSLSLITIGGFFQIIRTFRLFLFLRTFSIFPNLQFLILSLGQAIPKIISTALLLMLSIYIFAVWGVIEYALAFPEWFGDLPTAFSTIFHAVILEHTWSHIYARMVEVDPFVGFFIYPTIIILNFLILHMVVGVIINALHLQNMADQEHKKHSFILGWLTGKHKNPHDSPLSADTKIILHEIHKLKADLSSLRAKSQKSPKQQNKQEEATIPE